MAAAGNLTVALEKILLSDKPVIIDFDDAHHLYYKGLRSSLLRSVFADKIENLMRHATTVVVGNGMLEDYARAVGAKDVALIPSAVDVAHYKMIQSANDRFTIGWIGTPVTAKQSLPLLRGPFQKFLSETGSRCVLIGAGEDQSLGIDADRLSWSEAGEADFFAQITVGLCPLEDTPWNRGKSGYKIIQYMAAGKPALVSPVGIAGDLITHGETGFYCRSEEDWYTFLMQLYQDKELRFAMGARAQAEAETKYDTALAADKLYQIFEACL
jgi:glycosyltransferase involved in cell wall biosynthesis